MGKLEESLDFLEKDLEKAKKQWVGPYRQFMSLLQREDKSLSDLLQLFDPAEDVAAWTSEYNTTKKGPILQVRRKRLSFLKNSRKEFHEDYDPQITDCDFMRLLEIPYTDPEYVIKYSREDMKL